MTTNKAQEILEEAAALDGFYNQKTPAKPDKDVVEGALEVIGKWMALTPVALDCAQDVAAFATACVAREREACARIAKEWCDAHGWPENIVAAIRAGGGR